jgi:UDP-3-O-[3-hydroxymyristoyl] glucosamine N-acyltransferase
MALLPPPVGPRLGEMVTHHRYIKYGVDVVVGAQAVLGPNMIIGSRVSIGEFVDCSGGFIRIGDDSIIERLVVIRKRTKIGPHAHIKEAAKLFGCNTLADHVTVGEYAKLKTYSRVAAHAMLQMWQVQN